jgi:hypothetical protein
MTRALEKITFPRKDKSGKQSSPEQNMKQKQSTLAAEVGTERTVTPSVAPSSEHAKPSARPIDTLLQRLHLTAGNRAVGQWIQAKLRIGTSDDPCEQEADLIADRLVQMPVSPAPNLAKLGGPSIRRKCAECEAEENNQSSASNPHACPACATEDQERELKPKSAFSSQTLRVSPHLESRIDALNGHGEPLSNELRSLFEPRIGSNFQKVRIHTDANAADAAKDINAHAFTCGENIAFAAGKFTPNSIEGKRLLAHELVHVAQQAGSPNCSVMRSTNAQTSAGSGSASGTRPSSALPSNAPGKISVDILSAADPDDFLVRAAAESLGVDIRVRSMKDMIDQLEHLTSGNPCLSQLNIFNHANPDWQLVSGGRKTKAQPAQPNAIHDEGFSIGWLTNGANQSDLNRLRHTFCCNPSINWYGCSTAGVWAQGDERTVAEQNQDKERYTGTFSHFYRSVAEAAAYGATSFRGIGSANVQSWSNALCGTVNAATDFTSWRTAGSHVIRTVIHGGQEKTFRPESGAGCSCDPSTGRLSGSALTAAQLVTRAAELRDEALRPLFTQTVSVLGTTPPVRSETPEQRADREKFESEQQQYFAEVGASIQSAVLERAGLPVGASPKTPDEALKVASLWGLDLAKIVSNLGSLSASLSGKTTTATETGLVTQQQNLEAALSSKGRETFLNALLAVRREHFWDNHLRQNTIFIFPDLSGVNRYRGYTQHSSKPSASGPPENVWVIHMSKDLLETGATELAAASIVHELSHTLGVNVLERSMKPLESNLAELLADHPNIEALRRGAPNPATARVEQVRLLRQMLYEATGYAEAEIFAHLQQLTHQPNMTINGTVVGGTHFILAQITGWVNRLVCIGLKPQFLSGLLASIGRRVQNTYDLRIAAAPAGSHERQLLEIDKNLAKETLSLALLDAGTKSCKP